MKITLQPETEYHSITGEGTTFTEASRDLFDKLIKEFGNRVLDDMELFRGIVELKEKSEYTYFDMDNDDGFTLTRED